MLKGHQEKKVDDYRQTRQERDGFVFFRAEMPPEIKTIYGMICDTDGFMITTDKGLYRLNLFTEKIEKVEG